MSPAAQRTDRRMTLTFWSITLIGGGVWLLLLNFNLLARYEPTAQYILAGVLALIGLGFFGAFLGRREKWWRLIPGWLLLTLAAMVLLGTRAEPVAGGGAELAAERTGRLIAAILFGGLALAFFHVFLLRRSVYWWAIIPSGFMLVLGGVIVASIYVTRLETLGALLSIGMGLVFVLLYGVARNEQGWWPLIPATVLILFGLAAFTTGSNIQNALLNLWPLLLVLVGVWLGWLAWGGKGMPERGLEVNSSPTMRRSPEHASPPPRRAAANIHDAHESEHEANNEGVLGAYSGPAPGASVDVLDDRS